jgi:hypothetical protein
MKTYLNWYIKEIDWKYWTFLKASLKLEDLIQNKNEKWYINFVISKRKEIWKYWETHSAYIDDWKPQESLTDKLIERNNVNIQDLPF